MKLAFYREIYIILKIRSIQENFNMFIEGQIITILTNEEYLTSFKILET